MRVAYVCEGAGALGWGHLTRGYALWEAARDAVTIVVGRGRDEFGAWARQRGIAVPVAPWRASDMPLDPATLDYDLVIVDDYFLDEKWIADVTTQRPTFVFDDWMRRLVRATGLINPNLGASREDYPDSHVQQWMLGPQYALIRREVREAAPSPVCREVAARVLVTFGGSDPDGRTAVVTEALTQLPWYADGGSVTVVLGTSYAGDEPWRRWSSRHVERMEVLRRPNDFVARCRSADLVICSASTTTYELALLGRPFLPVAVVENQARVGAAWAERGVGRGLCAWADDWLQLLLDDVSQLTQAGTRRADVAASASQIVDGRGAERLLRVLEDAAAASAPARAPRGSRP